ncbi:virulence factor SrfB [bacterium]|nr:virulence factor SrfB [bacterium]
MEKIEFIAATGISFYSPSQNARIPESILERKQSFRILRNEKGQITIQFGTMPLEKVENPPENGLTDIGQISIKFQDALNACLRKWIPLPYARKNPERSTPSKSNDWIRFWLSRPPLSNEDTAFRIVFSVDTSIQPFVPQSDQPKDCLGFFSDDIGFAFEPNIGSTSFWQSSTLFTWIQSIFKQVPTEGFEKAPPSAISMAAFMTFVEGLRSADLLPEVTMMRAEGQPVEAHLILDLGNSRACGILAECEPGQPISLDECNKLEIRDLSRPTELYTEPFDTSFKFQPPLFFSPDNPIPHVGTGFRWPSIVRLGQEAAQMEPVEIGETGMSSPKRYLWDDRQKPYPWYFNLPDDGLGKKISAPFLKNLDDSGNFLGNEGRPPFEPCYPPNSMMTFLILEILNHAYAQINSYSYRKFRGIRQAKRILKSLVITTPCAMSEPEKQIYRQRVQSAIDIYFHSCKLPVDGKPQLFLDFDEATSVQLTYLYGEVKHRFLGETKHAISTLGKERTASNGNRETNLRVASIDIGGGTTDLMIAEYYSPDHGLSGLYQKMLFSEGFSIAGDEIAKRIIEKIVLKRVYDFAKEKNASLAWEEFQGFWGPSKGGRDKKFLDDKAEICRQVWIPMAHKHLEFAELDLDEPILELTFDKFFPRRLPGGNILDFFARHLKQEFGCDITLTEIPWVLSKRKINAVVSNVMENILRIFSEVISQFDCDVIILGGKPSSLPVIRELLVRFMPVQPGNIIGLKGFSVGSWYPFSQKGGGISDPKTACVVGAAVWLFAEKLNNLDGLSLKTDRSRIVGQECFIGPFNPEAMTLKQKLFPNPNNQEVPFSLTKPVFLGSRRIDSDVCTVNPVWELSLDLKNLKSQGPFTVYLNQDPNSKQKISLSRIEDETKQSLDLKKATLRLRSMVTDQYWLDSGSFDL